VEPLLRENGQKQLTGAFRTAHGDEVDPEEPSLVMEGARYWSAVELLGSNWYVVIGSHSLRKTPRTYFFTELDLAIAVLAPAHLTCARVFACIATPGCLHGDEAFGELAEVLTSADASRYVVRFKTGLDLVLTGDHFSRADNNDCKLRPVFRASSAPLESHS
jgi:hypothetical protein